jgi:hypothetical protein
MCQWCAGQSGPESFGRRDILILLPPLPKRDALQMHDRCDLICPDLPKML